MNVCITRAKSLLIMVGNPETLMRNDLWNSFIHFCKANGAFCGEPFSLKKLTYEEENLLQDLNNFVAQLTVTESADDLRLPEIEKNEKLKVLEERMAKLQMLMQKVDLR